MTQIGIQPIVLKDVILTIGADTYEKNVSAVAFNPSSSVVKWKGLNPTAVFSDVTTADWECALTFAQDWLTPASLSQLLFTTAEGTVLPASFKPRSGSGPSFTANLISTPGSIGGAVDSIADSTVTLGMTGKPALVLPGGVPLIALVNPVSGGIAGGNLVQIFGSGFTGATAVKFGAVAATTFTVISDSLIVAVPSAQAAGAKAATVTTPAGISIASPYTYV